VQEISALRGEVDRLRREYAGLEADMTGLADKLARQLKRIRSRAVTPSADDEDEDDSGPNPFLR